MELYRVDSVVVWLRGLPTRLAKDCELPEVGFPATNSDWRDAINVEPTKALASLDDELADGPRERDDRELELSVVPALAVRTVPCVGGFEGTGGSTGTLLF